MYNNAIFCIGGLNLEKDNIKTALSDGLTGININTSKFKTVRTAVCFILPVNKKNVACASLLSKLLCRSTADYPTPKALRERLNFLYGAELSASTVRCGDNMVLKFSSISICDKYALSDESVTAKVCELLKSAIFNPKVKDGAFCEEDFRVEKRLVIEEIRGLINEKRSYAVTKALEKMCHDEPFGIIRDEKTVEAVNPQELFDFWKNLLETAPVYIINIGENDPEPIFRSFKSSFDLPDRRPAQIKSEFSPIIPQKTKEFSEQMEISQGKLVMGFRTEVSSASHNIAPLRVMTDIFGGAPYSKLFTVVREKMSLCYYCAARLYSVKGIVCVDSGIEIENLKAAEKGITDQLELIQKGEFDEEIINASKIGLSDAVRSVEDTSGGIENWYVMRLLDKQLTTPAEFIRDINAVTKEDIINAAKGVRLDTVYVLKGKEGEN